MEIEYKEYEHCRLCARNCGINRYERAGYCGMGAQLLAGRAALHYWEEPIISGKEGSGAVFFTGCSLRCVFCQNYNLAHCLEGGNNSSKALTAQRLSEDFLRLQEEGANNINLVTGTHYVPHIAKAIEKAKNAGLEIPVLYNTGTYDNVETVKILDGLVDIYLPDLKYVDKSISGRYSRAKDYFEVATAAIAEMYRQVGKPKFVVKKIGTRNYVSLKSEEIKENEKLDNDQEILMQKGVVIRHMMLPGALLDSKRIVKYVADTYGDNVYMSLMCQYTPLHENLKDYPEIDKKVSRKRYERLVDYAIELGIKNAFIQSQEAVSESFIPAFDGTGI